MRSGRRSSSPGAERVAACKTLDEVKSAQDDLADFTILDPACGSGNFLYVAYRELRDIEHDLADRERKLRREAGLKDGARTGIFTLANLRGNRD